MKSPFSQPRLLGLFLLAYAITPSIVATFDLIWLELLPKDLPKGLYEVTGSVLFGLRLVILAGYLTGGIGLFILKRWACTPALMAPLADIAMTVLTVLVTMFLSSAPKGYFMRIAYISALHIILPALIARWAFKIRKQNKAWQPGKSKNVYRRSGHRELKASKTSRFVSWVIITTGSVLPWLVGVWVKLQLQAEGKPTIPWSYFLNVPTLLTMIPLTAWQALPYIGLAFFGKPIIDQPSFGLNYRAGRIVFILGGLVGGWYGTIDTFDRFFNRFVFLELIEPLWATVLSFMLFGLVVGALVAKIGEKSYQGGKKWLALHSRQ